MPLKVTVTPFFVYFRVLFDLSYAVRKDPLGQLEVGIIGANYVSAIGGGPWDGI